MPKSRGRNGRRAHPKRSQPRAALGDLTAAVNDRWRRDYAVALDQLAREIEADPDWQACSYEARGTDGATFVCMLEEGHAGRHWLEDPSSV